MLIRLMNLDDLTFVTTLEKQLFATPWTKQDFLYEMFDNDFAYLYVLEDQGIMIGYVGLWVMYEQSQITTIGIDPSYQHQGLGTLLLQKVMLEAKRLGAVSMSLEVRVSNCHAIGLYEKCGFHRVSLRKNYYQDNYEDAYVYLWEVER